MTNLVVVLPNKRARIFLMEAFRRNAGKTIFSPQIVSIEDLILEISGLRSMEPAELLFHFYEVYLSLEKNPQSFELFANWAKMLLQDFNEIDRYLLDPNHVLSYLKDIEDIKRWGIEVADKTPLLEKYVDFWKQLPSYYNALYDHLMQQGAAYQGLIYREAVHNIDHYSENKKAVRFIFAGFNALNAAEEKIIQHLLSNAQANIFWDAESLFLEDVYHDTGLFMRRFREKWSYYKSYPFEWITNDFTQPKNIRIIGTPKSVGQARIAGELLQNIIQQNGNDLSRTALILGDENLLIPILHSIPAEIKALNITMGYTAKNNPVQLLVTKLFKLHTTALSKSGKDYVFYYRDLLDVLTHPFVEPFVQAYELVNIIKSHNFTFVTHKKLFDLYGRENEMFSRLFHKWDNGPVAVLQSISDLLLQVREHLAGGNREEKIAMAFVFTVYKLINKLINYCITYPHIDKAETIFAVYKQLIDLAEVSFEGEPLDGLQVMGVLESRVLDFETVIITSVNEGSFPAGKSHNSFIPHDVKRELGLPTYKEKDAIYTYHFYHLLQRAKNIYLLYNTESEGLDAGEKSRFITQLEVEGQKAHNITHEIRNAFVPDTAYTPVEIPKTALAMERLQTIAKEGFSPSALTSYIRNPLDFYYRKILRIREADEVEENIALNTLGTIIHGALEQLFKPYTGQKLSLAHIDECHARLDDEVARQFREIFREGEIKKGRNLLAFEVARRNVLNFLKLEKTSLEEGDDVVILGLEETHERLLEHESLPFPVLVKGNIDRVELRNGRIRIIDYKTGKVEGRHVALSQWDGLTSDVKYEKIIQVLAYAYIYEEKAQGREIEVGIISFKNMKSGFLPFKFKEDKKETAIVNFDISGQYIAQLVLLLNEIFDPNIAFRETVD